MGATGTEIARLVARPMLTSAVEVTLEPNNERISDEQRPMLGQSVPIGDAGTGQTGVPVRERGIPNHPDGHALNMAGDANEEEADLEDDEDADEDADDEDLDQDDESEDDGEDDLEDEEDETTDPGAEPGKPV
jgi:hypothetical protein